jgi:hypothetical protein
MSFRPSFFSLLLLGFLLLTEAFGAAAQPPAKLRRVTLAPQMSALLPADFQVMPDDAIATKYPAPRKPVAAYTSPSGQIDFVVSQKSTPFKAGDLPMLLRFYKANILNLYSNSVQFSQEKVVTINGTDFIALEFTSALSNTGGEATAKGAKGALRRYAYLLYTVLPPKTEKELPQLLTFTFACPVVLADTWKPVAQQVMASVKLK